MRRADYRPLAVLGWRHIFRPPNLLARFERRRLCQQLASVFLYVRIPCAPRQGSEQIARLTETSQAYLHLCQQQDHFLVARVIGERLPKGVAAFLELVIEQVSLPQHLFRVSESRPQLNCALERLQCLRQVLFAAGIARDAIDQRRTLVVVNDLVGGID